ncbi:MAG: TIGR02300 family protein [Sphingomonadales bacterium]|nr:TIGR02300 family protein [Sphingomonadales bacterium]
MYKPEWGTKHTCPKCSTRFYDLGNDEPAVCIECGTEWVPEPILKTKQPIVIAAVKKEEPAKDAEAETEDDVDVEDDDDEDDSVLADMGDDDDDEDVAVVLDTKVTGSGNE